jgi:cell division protein FtsL
MSAKRSIKKIEIPVPVEIIQNKIFLIREHKVILDGDLAELYNVPNKRLKEQVRRNLKRFPEDFMFELTWQEAESLRSQFATLKRGEHIKYLPFAFTEQGVAMLSSVLNSNRAIEVNIQIMRVFTKLREMMFSHKDLARKIEDLERKFQDHDQKIIRIFDAIRQMMAVPDQAGPYKRSKIGFIADKGDAQ